MEEEKVAEFLSLSKRDPTISDQLSKSLRLFDAQPPAV